MELLAQATRDSSGCRSERKISKTLFVEERAHRTARALTAQLPVVYERRARSAGEGGGEGLDGARNREL